jgi:hypothetical protein
MSIRTASIALSPFSKRDIDMKHLSIPPATDAQKTPIIERVQKILAAKKNVGASPCGCPPLGGNCTIDGDSNKGDRKGAPLQKNQTSEVLETSEVSPLITDVSALEAEIDCLVYALYGLTEDEIAVVEGKK